MSTERSFFIVYMSKIMGNVTFHIWKGLSTDFLPRLVSVGV